MKKLLILSNVNLDLMNRALAKEFNMCELGGYNQWIQYAVSEEAIKDTNPDMIFTILDGNSLLENVPDNRISQQISEAFSYIEKLAISHPTIPIFVSNIDLKPNRIIEGDVFQPEYEFVHAWDEALRTHLDSFQNLHLFDLKTMIGNIGKNEFYSEKMWYMGSIPYSITGINVLTDTIKSKVSSYFGARKKVLVLDLDNTLWGGVIGEDGIEGIQLSQSLIGAAYRDAQKRIKDLKNLGIILAIVSKNNEEDVRNVLENHPNMVLRSDDFVKIYANWNPKANNISELASNLNLGLDSFVFLDDNPVEREAVRLSLPDVTVADFPNDISKLPQTIKELAQRFFHTAKLTTEDKSKTEQYLQEAKRQKVFEIAGSLEDFLQSLQIHVEVGEMTDNQLNRVAQLTQKTNQFNIRTKRFSNEEISKYRMNPLNKIYVTNVTDKFGDSGLVLVIMISINNKVAHIDNLLMSCRVMGRQIEVVAIQAIEDKLLERGIHEITTEFIPTKKNIVAEDVMENLNYEMIKNDNGTKHYRRVLTEKAPKRTLLYKPFWRN